MGLVFYINTQVFTLNNTSLISLITGNNLVALKVPI